MTQSPPSSREIDSIPTPDVAAGQTPSVRRGWLRSLNGLFPGGQFIRYLGVGVFNTIFGYIIFVTLLTLLNSVLPARLLYLTVVLASVLSTPLNITVAYFGYKLFVFRTKGNYLREWIKCFAVYGVGMIPGLVALSALTRFLQAVIHSHAAALHGVLAVLEQHLSGRPLLFLERIATGKAMAGYIAGAIVIGASTVYSFVGHKKVTFRSKAPESTYPLS